METGNEAVKERESFEVPGVGEIRARPGTSTAELAGAASYWHKKFLAAGADVESSIANARKQAFIAAGSLAAVLELAQYLIFHYWR